MLAEFLTKLTETVRQADKVTVTPFPGDNRRAILSVGGRYEVLEVPPPPRGHTIATLDDLVAFSETPDAEKGAFFVSERGVLLVLDTETRQEYAHMPFRSTARWMYLWKLRGEGLAFTPREAIRVLRRELVGGGLDVDAVIKALSNVEFTRRSDGRSISEHGRESLGKSVEAVVQAADKIPQSFEVAVPILRDMTPDQRYLATVPVVVQLLLEPEDGSVTFSVNEDVLRDAEATACNRIAVWLTDRVGQPVYRGDFTTGGTAPDSHPKLPR